MFKLDEMFQWDRFITPSVIKPAYLLMVGLVILYALSGIFSGLATMAISPFAGFIVILLSLLLLCSCATEPPAHDRSRPADQLINPDAGRGSLVLVTIQLESGQKLPMVVDTGADSTVLTKSLAPKIGKCLGAIATQHWGKAITNDIYAAPKLYLSGAPLMMTGVVSLRRYQGLAGWNRPEVHGHSRHGRAGTLLHPTGFRRGQNALPRRPARGQIHMGSAFPHRAVERPGRPARTRAKSPRHVRPSLVH